MCTSEVLLDLHIEKVDVSSFRFCHVPLSLSLIFLLEYYYHVLLVVIPIILEVEEEQCLVLAGTYGELKNIIYSVTPI